jgi:hypothetical protein
MHWLIWMCKRNFSSSYNGAIFRTWVDIANSDGTLNKTIEELIMIAEEVLDE